MGAGLQRAIAAARRTRYENCPKPAPNQRWQDNDIRKKVCREVVIFSVGDRKMPNGDVVEAAQCEVYIDGVKQKRETFINVARLIPTKTGYTYRGEGAPSPKAVV